MPVPNRSNAPRRPCIRVMLPVLAMLLGCGGGAAPPPAPPSVPSAPAPPPMQQVKRGGPARPAIGPTVKKPEQPQAAKIITSRDFVVMEPQPNSAVHSPEEIVRGAHYLIPPASSEGSSRVMAFPPDDVSAAAPSLRLNLPEGFTPLREKGITSAGLPKRIRCEADGAEMALVPAGVFTMGSNSGPPETGPAHPVYVSAFYIDVDEVTLQRYLKCIDDVKNSKRNLAVPDRPKNLGSPLDEPALGVTFRDAANYARFYGKTLPTEAEWEKAGRGVDGIYPWGSGRPLWHPARTAGAITRIGAYSADVSIHGVRDLAGNAREWVSDWYAADIHRQPGAQSGNPLRDPQGPSRPPESLEHVVKGGGPRGWELYHRTGGSARDTFPDVGFRTVLKVTPGMMTAD